MAYNLGISFLTSWYWNATCRMSVRPSAVLVLSGVAYAAFLYENSMVWRLPGKLKNELNGPTRYRPGENMS